MLFLLGELTEYAPKKHKIINVITEATYFSNDVDKLKRFRCPTCKEHGLFRGLVYIGCFDCMNYFSEKDIIMANLED